MKNILFVISIMIMGMLSFVTVSANVSSSDDVICTQEVKQCSDGSYVSRTGPKCEFAKCPVVTDPPISISPILPMPEKDLTDKVKKVLDLKIAEYQDLIESKNIKIRERFKKNLIKRLEAAKSKRPQLEQRLDYILKNL